MSKPVQIFIAYSRKDSNLLDELRVHFVPLERGGKVKIWYDGKIEPGAVWEDAIKQHLHGSDIILLLVSADAIASDYFYDKEVADALERHKKGEARVVPLILRPCAWDATPLHDLQALPKNGRPVTSWSDRDEAYTDAVQSLRKLVVEVAAQKDKDKDSQARLRQEAEAARERQAKEREEESRRRREMEKQENAREAERRRLQEAERLAVAARLSAYRQILTEARAMEQSARWEEARNLWNRALAMYEPEFPESRPALEQYIRNCETAMRGSPTPEVALQSGYMRWVAAAVVLLLIFWIGVKVFSGQKEGMTETLQPTDSTTSLSDPIAQLEADMIPIAGGSFTMGCKDAKRDGKCDDDEKPSHTVQVAAFSLGRYEVTQAQWHAVMGGNPSHFKNCDNCPVESLSWDDIQEFLQKLNALTGKKYRLPSEAEWEYAARGGNQSRGYLYSGSNDVNEVGWYSGNSGSKTQPVGGKKPNELGLYDMSGNVWEWCEDDWHDSYQNAPTDSRPWVDNPRGGSRVLRGGSWDYNSRFLRAASRDWLTPDSRSNYDGFRLARD